jgi:hypothetical protein
MKTQKNYYEKGLGKISGSIKNVKLSEKIQDIMDGRYDNDPIDPVKQPILRKINDIIAHKNLTNNINKAFNEGIYPREILITRDIIEKNFIVNFGESIYNHL